MNYYKMGTFLTVPSANKANHLSNSLKITIQAFCGDSWKPQLLLTDSKKVRENSNDKRQQAKDRKTEYFLGN